MHAFVRKGLLLSAATGTLVMGYAGTAAAQDSATARGAAADSPGAVSGNVAQVPADVPIQVCGDAVAAGAGMAGSRHNRCWTDDTTAEADGVAADSPGAVSGNVAQIPADVPIQACGVSGATLAADVRTRGNECADKGTHALAEGAAADSPGLVSGNVLQLPVDAPVQACGDAVAVLGFGTEAEDNRCVNGGPEMAPPVTMGPPVMSAPSVPCPPPVTNPCAPPPPPVTNPCLPSGSDTWSPSDSDTWSPSGSDTAAPSGAGAGAESPAPVA